MNIPVKVMTPSITPYDGYRCVTRNLKTMSYQLWAMSNELSALTYSKAMIN